MKRIFLVIVCIAVRFVYAQPEAIHDPVAVIHSGVVQQVDGAHYFFHYVRPGQTLYSIARAYSVTQEMLVDANADLALGLKADQIIRIPAFRHTVRPGETIYGLSRLYGLDITQIYAHNPGISDTGLKSGQDIFLPGFLPDAGRDDRMAGISQAPQMPQNTTEYKEHRPPLTRHDSVMLEITHAQQPDHFFEALPCPRAETWDTYHVALLIPLFLHDVPDDISSDSLMDEGVADGLLPLNHKSFSFLPYYHGVMLALDSVRNHGVDIRLHVYDVGEDEHMARQVVAKPDFAAMDLIIGPFYSKSLNYISNYALAHDIPVVSPLLPEKDQLRGFPNLFKATPSLEIQLDGLASYLSEKHAKDEIFIVHNNQPQAISIIQAFREKLAGNLLLRNARTSRDLHAAESASNVHEIIYIRETMTGLASKLRPGKRNVIVTLIGGEAFLSNYLRELNLHSKRFDLMVIGVPDWKNYQSLEIDYLQALKVHIFSPEFYDYQTPEIRDIVQKYRDNFKTEPSEDVFKGAQTAFFFFKALALYGRNFYECLDQLQAVHHDMHFVRPLGNRDGWENSKYTLFKYEDFQLKKVY